uniref:Uncharacterized protein n=1 Tax=Odontella aurita TaxID=265563 RepID=A0A7S4MGV5_9STRA|mmetsp:Transcript_21122/g.61437  ORF Transcript_21122/g.61437 Transcript_21122/m.61437 type:complete len:236 (+) Transcript_21122:50-757(+)
MKHQQQEDNRAADIPGIGEGGEVAGASLKTEDHAHALDNDGCSIGSLESVGGDDDAFEEKQQHQQRAISDGTEKYAGMDEKELEAIMLKKIRAAEAAWAAECVELQETKALLERTSIVGTTEGGSKAESGARRRTGPLFHNLTNLSYAIRAESDENSVVSVSERDDSPGKEDPPSEQVYNFEGSTAVPPDSGLFAGNPLVSSSTPPGYEFGLKAGGEDGVGLQKRMILGAPMEKY